MFDRLGCRDVDKDGYSNPTEDWIAHPDGFADAFPEERSQWHDTDSDGFGDNAVAGAYQPDACPKVPGTSTSNDEFGCPDADNDGVSDDADPCPWDPAVTNGVLTGPNAVKCAITSDPSLNTGGGDDSALGFSTDSTTFMALGGLIVLLLALIFVAQIAKASSKRKASAERAQEAKMDIAFSEEEERRLAWIDHYVAAGQLDEARALGWSETAPVPEWKQYEMQQQAAQDGAVPTMLDLNKL